MDVGALLGEQRPWAAGKPRALSASVLPREHPSLSCRRAWRGVRLLQGREEVQIPKKGGQAQSPGPLWGARGASRPCKAPCGALALLLLLLLLFGPCCCLSCHCCSSPCPCCSFPCPCCRLSCYCCCFLFLVPATALLTTAAAASLSLLLPSSPLLLLLPRPCCCSPHRCCSLSCRHHCYLPCFCSCCHVCCCCCYHFCCCLFCCATFAAKLASILLPICYFARCDSAATHIASLLLLMLPLYCLSHFVTLLLPLLKQWGDQTWPGLLCTRAHNAHAPARPLVPLGWMGARAHGRMHFMVPV